MKEVYEDTLFILVQPVVYFKKT